MYHSLEVDLGDYRWLLDCLVVSIELQIWYCSIPLKEKRTHWTVNEILVLLANVCTVKDKCDERLHQIWWQQLHFPYFKSYVLFIRVDQENNCNNNRLKCLACALEKY